MTISNYNYDILNTSLEAGAPSYNCDYFSWKFDKTNCEFGCTIHNINRIGGWYENWTSLENSDSGKKDAARWLFIGILKRQKDFIFFNRSDGIIATNSALFFYNFSRHYAGQNQQLKVWFIKNHKPVCKKSIAEDNSTYFHYKTLMSLIGKPYKKLSSIKTDQKILTFRELIGADLLEAINPHKI